MGFVTLPRCGGVLVKLHDFDLSKSKSLASPQNTPHWTGTLPFMAVGLLQAPESGHQIGFDVEALIWTLLWIVKLYDGDGKTAETPLDEHPLKTWFANPKLDELADNKIMYLSRPKGFTNKFYEPLEEEMRNLAWMWYWKLQDQIKKGQEQIRKGRDHDDSSQSEGLYGKEALTALKKWMGDTEWNKVTNPCQCQTHCAEK
ncbi:hypothetical protein M407DRAFT_174363 [Tulasnella calospora MUT 4182]|uniref:Fungal-type protein kinase domain-containing protein n=1 Tax=Tulasnella calospora MUT 4182 TaxID=1051891 RepID=A0A0C3Q2W6_9AGAM|nr:hypothetical protein M407DRAFT_174363 [Tulasnella calospora MUT 4182]